MYSPHHQEFPAPVVQLRALLRVGEAAPEPDEVASGPVQRGGLPPDFRLHTHPCPSTPWSPLLYRVQMLSPGHQSKRRKLKGTPSFKEVWVPGADVDFTFIHWRCCGKEKSPFPNGITCSNTQEILTHYSSPPPFFPIQGTCWEKEIW